MFRKTLPHFKEHFNWKAILKERLNSPKFTSVETEKSKATKYHTKKKEYLINKSKNNTVVQFKFSKKHIQQKAPISDNFMAVF